MGSKGTRDYHPAADGQMGTVIQVYRDWQISGDDAWLAQMWPRAKKALEFAWRYWDADRDGVMEGMQHNTYDIEFHGPPGGERISLDRLTPVQWRVLRAAGECRSARCVAGEAAQAVRAAR